MGYNLTIGEAVFDVDEVGDDDWTETVQDELIRVTAATVKLPNAPAFGEPTDHTNQRWPSYTQWYDFCEQVDLLPAMFNINEDGSAGSIRGGHPGYFPITKAFKKEVDNAYDNWKTQYPDAKTEYTRLANGEYDQANGAMCRLEWLKYWTDWALDNCDMPIFANS
jgi:hypothetical protein